LAIEQIARDRIGVIASRRQFESLAHPCPEAHFPHQAHDALAPHSMPVLEEIVKLCEHVGEFLLGDACARRVRELRKM
jgi:hypothetical protein